MASSAAICVQDAKHMLERGFFSYSLRWSTQSLKYSQGIGGKDYIKVSAWFQEADSHKLALELAEHNKE